MKTKKLIALMMTLFMLIETVVIVAAKEITWDENKVSIVSGNGVVSIVGTAPVQRREEISFIIFNPGYNAEMLDSVEYFEAVNYQNQVTTDSQGNFRINYVMNGGTGEYEAIFTIKSYNISCKKSFVYIKDTWANYRTDYSYGSYDDSKYRNGGYDASYDPDYDCSIHDTQETKYFFKENFTYTAHNDDTFYKESDGVPSGWDSRMTGGTVNGLYYHGDYSLIDTSENFPVELSRGFENADHGEVTLELQIGHSNSMDGSTIKLLSNTETAIEFTTLNNSMYLKNANENIFLYRYTNDIVYGLKMIIDIDNCKIKELYVNGEIIVGNLDFTKEVDFINRFLINTGDAAKGTMKINMAHLYRGYIINEGFRTSQEFYIDKAAIKLENSNIPDDFIKTGDMSIAVLESQMKPDVFSLKMKPNSKISKRFNKSNGNLEVGVNLYKLADGTRFILKNDENVLLTIASEQDRLTYITQDGEISDIGGYKSQLWNKIVVNINTEEKSADIYINYKKVAENIAFEDEYLSGIEICNSNDELYIDDIIVKQKTEEPEDYVPFPDKCESEDVLIGMQFCPMWEEGSHMGWDYNNALKMKTPYIGYYDQSSPEAIDWIIKQLLEHGVDFMKIAWIGQPSDAAMKSAFIGGSFMDGYFNAKYSDQMPFMIMWENAAMDGGSERLINSYAEYWIEYYFKNDKYLKINNRPVVGIYSISKFIENSGGEDAAKKAILDFRNMCINENVGNPIILGGSAKTQASMELFERIGLDGAQSYWDEGKTDFNSNAVLMKESSDKYTDGKVAISPNAGMGVVDFGKNFAINPGEWQKNLIELKNGFFADYSHDTLGKMLLLETYDEYSEGHWLAPSAMYGFAYLDVVREVFCDDESEHIDVVPNMVQKDRFNNLYPYGRTLDIYKSRLKNPSKINILQKYQFNPKYDKSDWHTANSSNTVYENGVIKAIAATDDPQVVLQANVDISDVTYLRMKIKNNSGYSNGQFFFATENHPDFTEKNSIPFSTYGTGENIIELFVGGLNEFYGNLTKIRIDPGKEAGISYEISDIELLYDPDYFEEEKASCFRVLINDSVYNIDKEFLNTNEKTLFPLGEIVSKYGYTFDYDYYGDKANIVNAGDHIIIKGDGKIIKNGVTISDAGNDVLFRTNDAYVDINVLGNIFGVVFSWNDDATLLFEQKTLIYNATFDTSLGIYGDLSGRTYEKTTKYYHSPEYSAATPAGSNNDIHLVSDKKLTIGKTYELSFWAMKDPNITDDVKLQIINGDNASFLGSTITLTDTMKRYFIKFVAQSSNASATELKLPRIRPRIATLDNAKYIYFDDIVISESATVVELKTNLPNDYSTEVVRASRYSIEFSDDIKEVKSLKINGIDATNVCIEGAIVSFDLELQKNTKYEFVGEFIPFNDDTVIVKRTFKTDNGEYGSFGIKTETGQAALSLLGGEKYIVSAKNVFNNSEKDGNINAFIAIYKNDGLYAVKNCSISTGAGEMASELTAEIELPEDISDGVYKIKAFLWSEGMVPLSKSINLS